MPSLLRLLPLALLLTIACCTFPIPAHLSGDCAADCALYCIEN